MLAVCTLNRQNTLLFVLISCQSSTDTPAQQLLESIYTSENPRKHPRTHSHSHPLTITCVVCRRSYTLLTHLSPTYHSLSHPLATHVPTPCIFTCHTVFVLGMRLHRRGRRCLGQGRSSRVFDQCTRRGPSPSKSAYSRSKQFLHAHYGHTTLISDGLL